MNGEIDTITPSIIFEIESATLKFDFQVLRDHDQAIG